MEGPRQVTVRTMAALHKQLSGIDVPVIHDSWQFYAFDHDVEVRSHIEGRYSAAQFSRFGLNRSHVFSPFWEGGVYSAESSLCLEIEKMP
jgi:hypothetical protein